MHEKRENTFVLYPSTWEIKWKVKNEIDFEAVRKLYTRRIEAIRKIQLTRMISFFSRSQKVTTSKSSNENAIDNQWIGSRTRILSITCLSLWYEAIFFFTFWLFHAASSRFFHFFRRSNNRNCIALFLYRDNRSFQKGFELEGMLSGAEFPCGWIFSTRDRWSIQIPLVLERTQCTSERKIESARFCGFYDTMVRSIS